MRLIIQDNYDKTSEWAAKYIQKRINTFGPTPENLFVLGLPTGENFKNKLKITLQVCIQVYLYSLKKEALHWVFTRN